MSRFETLIAQCDLDIRQGLPQNAVKRLSALNAARVPREWRLATAKICRRAGLFSLGLRLLSKLVNHSAKTASDPEHAEYAMLLLRSGAVNEALRRLQAVDAERVPDAFLFRAYGYFAQWEHGAAISELEKYLQNKLTPGAELLGRTNLAFAHVECRRHKRALLLLEQNIQMAKAQNHLHLECYNHAVRGQVFMQEGDFKRAREEFNLARREFSAAQTSDQFFVTKLELITEGLKTRSQEPFARLRRLAMDKRDWFAIRDAELFSLKVEFNRQRFLHLYFGSPLNGFRACIRRELGVEPDRTIYVFGSKSAPRFDLTTGKLDGSAIINVGGKCHQMLEVLLRDFYEPLRIAGLYSALFPDEQFDITTSPDRVRQLIRRTRGWLKRNHVPARIREDDGFYSLVLDGPFSFRVPLNRVAVDHMSLQMQKLDTAFQGKSQEKSQGKYIFSTQEICDRLSISVTSAHRLLRHAIESGRIERLGPVKRPTGYRFAV